MEQTRKRIERAIEDDSWEFFEKSWANWLAWGGIGLIGAIVIVVIGMSISLLGLELFALLRPA